MNIVCHLVLFAPSHQCCSQPYYIMPKGTCHFSMCDVVSRSDCWLISFFEIVGGYNATHHFEITMWLCKAFRSSMWCHTMVQFLSLMVLFVAHSANTHIWVDDEAPTLHSEDINIGSKTTVLCSIHNSRSREQTRIESCLSASSQDSRIHG
jgi:hypothetical protein